MLRWILGANPLSDTEEAGIDAGWGLSQKGLHIAWQEYQRWTLKEK